MITIEALQAIRFRFGGKAYELQPGQRMDLPPDKALLALQRAPGSVRLVDSLHITWQRADGSMHSGLTDFIHQDADGSRWAFVTTQDGWSAVNLKFATVSQQATA